MARIPYNEQENRDYWRKRHLKLKAKQIESTEEYQRQLNKRLGYVERAFENELKGWYKKYAANNNINFEQASNLLKDIDTQYFDLTLDEFKSRALEGGYDRLLNNQYFKERVTRLKALQKDFESKLSDDEVQNLTSIEDDTKVGYINDNSNENDNSYSKTLILFNNKNLNQGYFLNTIALWAKNKKPMKFFYIQ